MGDRNASSLKMTVLGAWEADRMASRDNSLQFMFVLFLKVLLNGLVAAPCSRSLQRSLMGYCAISLLLADGLLLLVLTGIWLLKESFDTMQSLCFVLAHSATVYSVLPLPILLLGTVEHVSHLQRGAFPISSRRSLLYCTLVLLLWALACLYSSSVTNTELMEVWHIRTFQLCMVQDSSVVTHFNTGLCFLTLCVLLPFHQEVVLWARATLRYLDSCPVPSQSDLKFTVKKVWNQQSEEAGLVSSCTGQHRVRRLPFLLSLVFGFASSWAPFLLITTACWLLDLNAPSYISINLLWLMCANSLVVGVIFASWGEASGLSVSTFDEICDWDMCRALVHQDRSAHGIYTLSEKAREVILHI